MTQRPLFRPRFRRAAFDQLLQALVQSGIFHDIEQAAASVLALGAVRLADAALLVQVAKNRVGLALLGDGDFRVIEVGVGRAAREAELDSLPVSRRRDLHGARPLL
jgi:hypothetical protein